MKRTGEISQFPGIFLLFPFPFRLFTLPVFSFSILGKCAGFFVFTEFSHLLPACGAFSDFSLFDFLRCVHARPTKPEGRIAEQS